MKYKSNVHTFSSYNNTVSIKSLVKYISKQVKEAEPQGIDYSSTEVVPIQRKNYLIDYATIKRLYLNTPKIRECIDGISRRIATSVPIIKLTNNSLISEEKFFAIKNYLLNFFSNLNEKQDNLYTFLVKVVKDLLLFDFCIIEKVRNSNNELSYLYVRDPSNFYLVKDKHGRIVKFQQRVSGKTIEFNPEDIIFCSLTSSSFEDLGHPIIEVIYKEVVKLFLLYDNILEKIINENELPLGILALGAIGEEAFLRIKEEFINSPGGGLKVIRGLGEEDLRFIEVSSRSSGKAIDFIELVEKVEEIIYTAFQIQHLERIRVGEVAKLQSSYIKSNLIYPILNVLNNIFTYEICKKELKFPVVIEFGLPITNTSEFIDLARSIGELINVGVLSINEARQILGLYWDKNFDFHYIKLGNEILEVKEKPKRLDDFIEESD